MKLTKKLADALAAHRAAKEHTAALYRERDSLVGRVKALEEEKTRLEEAPAAAVGAGADQIVADARARHERIAEIEREIGVLEDAIGALEAEFSTATLAEREAAQELGRARQGIAEDKAGSVRASLERIIPKLAEALAYAEASAGGPIDQARWLAQLFGEIEPSAKQRQAARGAMGIEN